MIRLVLALLALGLLNPGAALAQTVDELKARRCWQKTALVLIGSSSARYSNRDDHGFPPSFEPALAASYLGTNPDSPAFPERFAGFVNAKWQKSQSTGKERNVPFLIARHVLINNLKWREVFTGRFDIDFKEGRGAVLESETGLGFFRVAMWQRQNAGNELAGYKLSTAYRMLNNIIGIKLTPAANNTAGDASAVGRSAAGCTGCHFNGTYPLDLMARVLTRRQGFGDAITFTPPVDGPQQLFGKAISNDEELVSTLVNSPAFTFNTCRLAFEFLFGRPESTCEAPVFDACVEAFEREGTIGAALMGMISHPGYCQ